VGAKRLHNGIRRIPNVKLKFHHKRNKGPQKGRPNNNHTEKPLWGYRIKKTRWENTNVPTKNRAQNKKKVIKTAPTQKEQDKALKTRIPSREASKKKTILRSSSR